MSKSMRFLDYDDFLLLELLAKGSSRGQIAARMCITPAAVSARVRKIGSVFMPIVDRDNGLGWRLTEQGFIVAASACEVLKLLRSTNDLISLSRRD